jgi:hypothetical protein
MRVWAFSVPGVALAVLFVPTLARGEGIADAARAEALFAEGRRLMAARDYAAACPKFADSEALDPAPGTALNLATCYERARKLASAWAAFKKAQFLAAGAGQRDRVAAAKKKVAALEAGLSRLTIAVPPSSRVVGLEVLCDDETLRDDEWGAPVPRDGGGHDIEARAPGKQSWTSHVELKDHGQSLEVEVPPLEDAPPTIPDAPSLLPPVVGSEPQAAPAPASEARRPPPEPAPRAWIQRPIALGVGGLGLAGLAFGAIAGLEARTSIAQARQACGVTAPACKADSQAFGLRDTAESWATASTIGFLAGGALVAAGAVLYITTPSAVAPSLGLGPAERGAGASLRGTF